MDNVQAGRMATEHLIALNHKNIVCIGGPSTMTTFQGRYEGFRQVMEENGLEVSDHNARITDTSEEAIRDVITAILAERIGLRLFLQLPIRLPFSFWMT